MKDCDENFCFEFRKSGDKKNMWVIIVGLIKKIHCNFLQSVIKNFHIYLVIHEFFYEYFMFLYNQNINIVQIDFPKRIDYRKSKPLCHKSNSYT